MGERVSFGSDKEKWTRTMQIWEGQTGGEDGYLSAGGLSSLFCSRVLEELIPVLFSCFLSYASLAAKWGETTVLVSSHGGRGWFSVPVCVCMSVGSDRHSKLYTIHQHLWRSCFMIIILIIAVNLGCFFPSKSVSCTGFFFFTFNYFWIIWRWGDKSD